MEEKSERSEFTAWVVTLLAGVCLGAALTVWVVFLFRPSPEQAMPRYSPEALMVTTNALVLWDISGGRHRTNGLGMTFPEFALPGLRETFRTNRELAEVLR